jgi:hypothetical protein
VGAARHVGRCEGGNGAGRGDPDVGLLFFGDARVEGGGRLDEELGWRRLEKQSVIEQHEK